MPDPCSQTHRLDALERKDESIFTTLKKMEDKFDSKLDLILFQINKIAVLEANHQHHSTALDRAFGKLEAMESDLRESQAFQHKTEGMARMAWYLWAAISGAVGFLIVKVFF